MEVVERYNAAGGLATETQKFVPIPIGSTKPSLERCYLPTSNAAYLQISDSLTSITSSVMSSRSEEPSDNVLSSVVEQAPGVGNPLTRPLSRLLIPTAGCKQAPESVAAGTSHLPRTSMVPPAYAAPTSGPSAQSIPSPASFQSARPIPPRSSIKHNDSPISVSKLQPSNKVPMATVNKLLVAQPATHNPQPPPSVHIQRSGSCVSHGLLEHLERADSVTKLSVDNADSFSEEPQFTVTSVKRSERVVVRKPKSWETAPSAPAAPPDPYINSLTMLTTLVSQNRTLVKTALDAISAVATHQAQYSLTHVAASEPVQIKPKTPIRSVTIEEPSHNSPHKSPLNASRSGTATSVIPIPPPPAKSKQSKIPKPQATVAEDLPYASKDTPTMSAVDIWAPTDKIKSTTDAHSSIIGVPIKASEHMSKTPVFGFLDTLLADDTSTLNGDNHTKEDAPTVVFDPFLQDLISNVSKLDSYIDDICGDVRDEKYTHSPKQSTVAPSPSKNTQSDARNRPERKIVRRTYKGRI